MKWISLVLLAISACAQRPTIVGAPCECPDGFVCKAGVCEPGILNTADAGESDAPTQAKLCPGDEGTPNARYFPLFPQQYLNTISAVTGVATQELRTPTYAGQGSSHFLNTSASLLVLGGDADTFRENAKLAATRLIAARQASNGCDPANEQSHSACRGFVLNRAAVAFRRPLDPSETDRLQLLMDQAATKFGMASAVHMALEAVLQSPSFLYRTEVGDSRPDAQGFVELTSFETASALSYFLTDAPPDSELTAAAAEGTLSSGTQRALHARRLLATPAAHQKLLSFFARLLRIDRPRSRGVPPPGYSEVEASMQKEFDAFLERHIWSDSAELNTLFSSHETFIDRPLGLHYGLTPAMVPVQGGQWVNIATRKGLFALGAVLVAYPNPSNSLPLRRGVMVLDALDCEGLPSPPPGNIASFTGENLVRDTTGREVSESFFRTSGSGCETCHLPVAELALGFEQFDEWGRHRTTQFYRQIDTSYTNKELGRFSNGEDYVEALMKTEKAQACLAQNLTTFALGIEDEPSACLGEKFQQKWKQGKLALPELLVHMAQDPSFTRRRFKQ